MIEVKEELNRAVIIYEESLKKSNDENFRLMMNTVYEVCESGLRGITTKYEDGVMVTRLGRTTMTKALTGIADIIEKVGDEKLAKKIRGTIKQIPKTGITNSLFNTRKYIEKHLSLNLNYEARMQIINTIGFWNAKLSLRKIEAKEKRVKRLLK